MPDDERKGRRLGDETKGRIADLASGWTVGSDAPPVPEPPIRREPSGPTRVALDAPRPDAPRRKAKTQPPPPPGSAARKALEEKIIELRDIYDAPEPAQLPTPPALPPGARPPPPVPARVRPTTGSAPVAGRKRAPRTGDPLDLATVPEADKTKENRGAVGVKHDKSASLTTNTASGTIGGDTPSPIFDRAAIAAGQRGAAASDDARGEPHGPGRLGSPPADGVPAAAERVPSGPADRVPSGPVERSLSGRAVAARGPDDSLAEAIASLGLPDGDERLLVVPVGEFDQAETILDQNKRRIAHAQATIKRDAAGALLGLAEPAPARMPAAEILFDEPTRVRGSTGFEEETTRRADLHDASGAPTGHYGRGDATGEERDDATTVAPPGSRATSTGTLRASAALPRRRGAFGDLRYIATVIIGLRRARRELAAVTARQDTRQQSRRRHLTTLGRAAATADAFEHKALDAARESLARIEDERSQHAGHVAAADAELTRVRRDRDAKAKQYATDIAAIDGEVAGLTKKLEPLHKEAAAARKRGTDLHDALRRIDVRIADTEASLDAPKPGKRDRAEIQAEIASLRAERKAIQSDEPAIAGQLDEINPRIAALEAARTDARHKRAELDTAEHDDQRRAEELLAAIGAKRKVVDRAGADAEALRDKILFRLGERLFVDRPDDLAGELAPVDEIDLELGSADRRLMELREILTSVDRWKLVRGIALLVVVIAALGAIAAGLLYFQLLG